MEQRRTRRFQLELPLSVTKAGTARVSVAGRTKNISSTGVLFTATREADLGGSIEYVITLNDESPEPVHLRCVGKVVRSQQTGSGDETRDFEVAATLERYVFVRDHKVASSGTVAYPFANS